MDERSPAREHAGLDLDEVVLAPEVSCRRCGYILKGLAASGSCPECGTSIVDTLRAIVDPAASRLPRLADPSKVGRGLSWLMLCAVLAALFALAGPVIERLRGESAARIVLLGVRVPQDLHLLSAIAAALGIWSIFRLKPPRAGEAAGAVWRDLFIIAAGLVGWSALAVSAWLLSPWRGVEEPALLVVVQILLCFAGGLILVGVGGVLRTIGLRSRIYRQSHEARQRVLAMNAAVAGVAVGLVVREAGRVLPVPQWVATAGTIVIWVSALMSVIGLLYMLMNAWWIRAALCSPPPELRELLQDAR